MNDEEIAIIGLSGRFPGAKNIGEFWENLCKKKESISSFSDEELRASGVVEHLLQNPSYVKTGFVLDSIDQFDADFFHISPREAIAMDPHQRILLECAWEALSDGGYTPGKKPLHVGVFVGGGSVTASYLLEYLKKHPEVAGTTANFHAYCTDPHYLATKVSHRLNLTGPSLTVQTACSTSMVAIHLASQAILRGECTMAIAGGISLRIPHTRGYLYSEGDILSSDGHCRTFDAKSSGTVFGNGAGLVLLKKQSEALADNDPIYAVIKKSSLNNDGGAKPSYPAPSAEGQTRCIKTAFSEAKIDAATLQFIEAHGTGTMLGDPIEVQALKQAFGKGATGYCALGSLKPNIGHLASAAGVASLIKLTLALHHHKIPAQINFQNPNPNIDFANSPFYINTETIEWVAKNTPRRGALSSFGVGGTNAFMILEEAPSLRKKEWLPSPFQRKHYWIEVPQNRSPSFSRIHPLLGWKVNTSLISDELLFENIFQCDEIDYLKDHCILDQTIYPAAAYIETFCAAAQAVGISLPLQLKHLEIKAAMPLQPTLHLQTKLKTIDGGYEAAIYRFDRNQWHLHALASLHSLTSAAGSQGPNIPTSSPMDSDQFYATITSQGYQFGPHFKTLSALWTFPSHSIGRASTDDPTELYTLYPPLFDGATQVALSLRFKDTLSLPTYIEEIKIFQRLPNSIYSVAKKGKETLSNHMLIYDGSGNELIEIKEHTKTRVEKNTLYRTLNNLLYQEVWQPSPIQRARSKELDLDVVYLEDHTLQTIVARLQKEIHQGKGLTIVSRGIRDVEQLHPLIPFTGLYRAVRLEFPDHRWIHIDLDKNLSEERAKELLAEEMLLNDGETEILFKEEGRYVNRVIRTHPTEPPSETKSSPLKDNEVEIAVQASALNFRDVLSARGLYPGKKSPIGSDICGIVTRKGDAVHHLSIGQSVFGIVSGAFQDQVIASSDWIVPRPDRLSPIQAAGMPIVFLTVYHALIQLANLQKNDRILIHCATGGVGLAAIQIAKEMGAEIFATAGTERKRGYLRSIGIKNIASSRTLDFVNEWEGRSISVVLNSLTGPGFIEGSLQLCEPNARFLELSKRNIWSLEQMAALRPDIRYSIVAIDAIKTEKPQMIRELLESIAKQAKPLPYTLFPLTQINPALDFLHQTQQIGKVVIKHPSKWRANLKESSYLITGGFGELGQKTAEWLIDQGATHLYLTGRNLPADIDSYRKEGIEVQMKSCDISSEEAVDELLREWKGPPLKGIIHAAGLLHNAGFLEHSWADFEKILSPKVQGAWALHRAILKYRVDLDWIVYYSSTSAFLGGHGTSAYSAANSFLDQFARYQQHLGLPAISVNWGAWRESGMAFSRLNQMRNRGVLGLIPAQAFQALAVALQSQEPQIGVMDMDWELYLSTLGKNNPRFESLRKKSSVSRKWSPPKNISAMQDYLAGLIRKTLNLPEDHPIDIQMPFIQQGIDSLQAIEFISHIEKDLQLNKNLRMHVLQTHPTIAALSQYLLPQEWSPLSEHMLAYWNMFHQNNYNIGAAVQFSKKVDVERLHAALNEVLKQNPIFYLSIAPNQPMYQIEPYRPCPLPVQNLDSEEELLSAYQKSIGEPFDPSDFPKCRATLYETGGETSELQIICPHMIADGRSIYLLLESIDQAYNGKLPPYSPEKDFFVQLPKYEAMIQENLAEKREVLKNYRSEFRPFRLPASLSEEQKRCSPFVLAYTLDERAEFTSACRAADIQVSLAFNSLVALALASITDQTEVSAACASNGLFSAEFSKVIGPFHKQLPLNIVRKKSEPLHKFLERLKKLQPLWAYLRECPSELLKVSHPPSKVGKAIKTLIQWKLLPAAALPFLKGKRPANRFIQLFINEMELKKYVNFTTVFQNRMQNLHQGVRVMSLLTPEQWEIHIAWPMNPEKQRLLSENIDSLLEEYQNQLSKP